MSESAPQGWDELDTTDDAPRRPTRSKKQRSSPLLVAALALGALVLLVGLGVGAYLAFGKSSAGKSPSGGAASGQLFTITKATRSTDPKNGKQIVAVTIESTPAQNSNGEYSLKARAGGQTSTYDGAFRIFPGMAGTIFLYTAEHGPAEVWVETSGGPNGAGTRVSNTYSIN